MRAVKRLAFQGDVCFRRVATLPVEAKVCAEKSKMGLAHSETGHHHSILHVTDVYRFDVGNPNICYLRVDAEFADVVHERSFDTHETLRLAGGGSIWEVRRQREQMRRWRSDR